jgi:hypothetical protein
MQPPGEQALRFSGEGPRGPFSHGWGTPALLFNRLNDFSLTPIPLVLEDAVGRRRFGEARLKPQQEPVQGDPCYVVEGTYDSTKLYNVVRDEPVVRKFRLWFSPRHGMQVVKHETFTLSDEYPNGIPYGILEIDGLVERDGIWLPVSAKLTTHAFARDGGRLRVWPAMITLIKLDQETLHVNENIDDDLFEIR